MQNQLNYGLQNLTPIYGQVIQSAPSWGGPFDVPTVSAPAEKPKTPSPWGALLGSVLGTAACAAIAPTGIGLLACPIAGQLAAIGLSNAWKS